MTPRELLSAHRYSEAIEACRRLMDERPELNLHAAVGKACLAVKRYPEALESFEKADGIESQRLKGSRPFVNWMGASLWLQGDRSAAVSLWRRNVDDVKSGVVEYGDAAGGATQGLLLWFGTEALGDREQRDYALDYLRECVGVADDVTRSGWPRAIAAMVLDVFRFEDVLEVAGGARGVQEAVVRARSDLLDRRYVCQVLFYGAAQARAVGNLSLCADLLLAASGLENPIIEPEWYLARGECGG